LQVLCEHTPFKAENDTELRLWTYRAGEASRKGEAYNIGHRLRYFFALVAPNLTTNEPAVLHLGTLNISMDWLTSPEHRNVLPLPAAYQ
jgi:hypothetical protein